MADGIVLNAGSGGATCATDDCGAPGHVQLFKLAYSADGVVTLVTADTNGLEVQLGLPLPAGTNNIGDVDVLTLPALPAGTNNIGDVDVLTEPRSSTVFSGAHTTSGTASTATEVRAANANRLEITVVNDSDTVVYLHLGATGGALNAGIRLNASGGSWSSERYTGAVRSISSGTSKVLTVTEVG